MRFGPILYVIRLEAVFYLLAIGLRVAHDDRPRVHFDDLALDAQVLYEHMIAVS